MQIAPVDHTVGIPEAGAKSVIERNAGDFVTADRVHQPQAVNVDRRRARLVANAQIVKGVEGVGFAIPCENGCRFSGQEADTVNDVVVFEFRRASTSSRSTVSSALN